MAAIPLASTPLGTDANLAFYVNFNGSVNDLGTAALSGTLLGGSYVDSMTSFGSAIAAAECQGSIDYGAMPSPNLWTHSFWIKPSDINDYRTITFCQTATGVQIRIANDDKILVHQQGVQSVATATSVVDFGTWQHWAITWNADDVWQYYKNGTLDAIGTNAGITFAAGNLTLLSQNAGTTYCFGGTLDEYAIFSRVLTADEISKIYTGAWATPPSTPTNGTPAAGTTGIATNGTLKASAYVNGGTATHAASQWIVAAENDFTNDIVFQTGGTSTQLVSMVIGTANGTFSGGLSGKTALEKGIPYWWKVRYQASDAQWSSYSTPTYFITTDPSPTATKMFNPFTSNFCKYKGPKYITSADYSQAKASTDAAAPNNSVYYSTNQTKLVYKDAAGTINNLY